MALPFADRANREFCNFFGSKYVKKCNQSCKFKSFYIISADRTSFFGLQFTGDCLGIQLNCRLVSSEEFWRVLESFEELWKEPNNDASNQTEL